MGKEQAFPKEYANTSVVCKPALGLQGNAVGAGGCPAAKQGQALGDGRRWPQLQRELAPQVYGDRRGQRRSGGLAFGAPLHTGSPCVWSSAGRQQEKEAQGGLSLNHTTGPCSRDPGQVTPTFLNLSFLIERWGYKDTIFRLVWSAGQT